jgi:hypothetical protein
MLIVDNVPDDQHDALSITPSRIQAIIQEANMTHFEGRPAQVVVIDHLGILEVDEDAPADVRRSEQMAPGHIMQRLFAVCKTTDVFMIMLQQLPKEVPPGKPFSYDAGRGGSKQTDFCDYIMQIWRPEQNEEIDEADRLNVSGQYKLALGKNRYGASTVAHLYFDKHTLRIMPALEVVQPPAEGAEEEVRAELEEAAAVGAGGAAGASPEGLETLSEQTDTSPEDTASLLAEIAPEEGGGQAGSGEEGPPEPHGNQDLMDWFSS